MAIHQVPLSLIDDSPFQTRRSYDDEHVRQLAESIKNDGLITPPIARIVDTQGKVIRETSEPFKPGYLYGREGGTSWIESCLGHGARVQLAVGHNRKRAFQLLGQETMPIELRPLSDDGMDMMSWSENKVRQDLSPIEEAEAIRDRIERHKWTQEQAAAALGLARPTVSNKLRLLKLPETVLEHVRKGELSERQASALVPMYDLSEEDLKLTEGDYYGPDQILQNALSGETSERIRQQITRLQENIEWKRKRIADEARQKEQAEKAVTDPGKVVDTSTLSYTDYENVSDHPKAYDFVAGCSPACPCRRLNERGQAICIDKKHRQAMKAQATRVTRKSNRAAIPGMLEAFAAKYRPDNQPMMTPAAIALIAEKAMSGGNKDHLVAALKDLGLPADLEQIREWNAEKKESALKRLVDLGADIVLMLIVQMWVRQDIGEWIEYTRNRPALYDELMASEPIIDVEFWEKDAVPGMPVGEPSMPADIATEAISGDGQATDAEDVAISDEPADITNSTTQSITNPVIDEETSRAIDERAAGRHVYSEAEIAAVAEPADATEPPSYAVLLKQYKLVTAWMGLVNPAKLMPDFVAKNLAELAEIKLAVAVGLRRNPDDPQLTTLLDDIRAAQRTLIAAQQGEGKLAEP